MIRGYKPSGYTVSFTSTGAKVEAETRQCVHCQFSWEYGTPHLPDEVALMLGHSTRRGYCVQCGGWVCCRDVCIQRQLKLTKDWLDRTGKVRTCIPFEEWNDRIRNRVEQLLPHSPNLTVTESGLVIPTIT